MQAAIGPEGFDRSEQAARQGRVQQTFQNDSYVVQCFGGSRVHFWAGLLACCRIISTAPVTTQCVDSSGCSMQLTWPKVPGREGSSGRWGL